MSVLIKDIKMPESCLDCPIYDNYNYQCNLYGYGIPARYNYDPSKRPEWCKLEELPEHHGRLFDQDDVKAVLYDMPDTEDKWDAITLLEWAIDKRWCIEAEGVDE